MKANNNSSYFQKYKEIDIIGRGSFGTANLVQSVEDGIEYVAKKVVLGSLSQKEVESAQLEVRLLRELKHPNIVQYKECFIEEGLLITIMEYCEEGDLKNKITKASESNQHFDEVKIINWFVQVVSAIEYVHRNKILHRDIKTSNIFLKSDGSVKIGDFGIAKAFENTNEIAMTVIGTPYYLSPEVCENKPYTYKSDIWALGCVLYEMNALKNAFTSKNLLSLIYKIVRDDFDPLPSYVSSSMTELIKQLLTKDEALRPSAFEVLESPLIEKIQNASNIEISNEPKTHFQEDNGNENSKQAIEIIANNTMKVVSLLEEESQEKPQEITSQNNFWVKSSQPIINRQIPEPSAIIENDDISIFHLSFGDQKKLETVFRNEEQKHKSNLQSNENSASVTVIDSSRPVSANDLPQDHHQKRLRNIQRMIPKNHHRPFSSKNPSILQKESTENQQQQQQISNSRKPVILNNFHLIPEMHNAQDIFGNKTNESLELADSAAPFDLQTTQKSIIHENKSSFDKQQEELMQTCMSYECPKAVIHQEGSVDFEPQRNSEQLSQRESVELKNSNHQMRKTFKDSTKSNSKRDNKSSASDDDHYEDDYEEYDEEYEEDFEEYCSENEQDEEEDIFVASTNELN